MALALDMAARRNRKVAGIAAFGAAVNSLARALRSVAPSWWNDGAG